MSRYFYENKWSDKIEEGNYDYYQGLLKRINSAFTKDIFLSSPQYVIPKTEFKGVIKMNKSLIERLRQERDELEEKIIKIKKFNNSESFEYLDRADRDLLIAQENAMVTYHQILQMRIKKRNKEY